MDGTALLTLAPESIASIMQVTGVDPRIVEYISRSMLLESAYLSDANESGLAAVRAAQARAIADEYGFELPDNLSDSEAIMDGLEEAALEGGFDAIDHSYDGQLDELTALQEDLFGWNSFN